MGQPVRDMVIDGEIKIVGHMPDGRPIFRVV